ncbi:hypothetical protein Q8F55_003809 [Vanrija albida]|uniref:Uncharacterized protein n=1 Tax=Vanrija albida TaxID=181172 RepID=A0ABR3Q5C4_9TREE
MLYAVGHVLAKRGRQHYDNDNSDDYDEMSAIGRCGMRPTALTPEQVTPAPTAPAVPDIPKEWAAQLEAVAQARVATEAAEAEPAAPPAPATAPTPEAPSAPSAAAAPGPLDPPASWAAQLREVATHTHPADPDAVGTSPTGPTAIPEPEALHRVDSADLRRRHSAHHHHAGDAPHHHHDLAHPLQEIRYHAHAVLEAHPALARAEERVAHGFKEAGHSIEVALENSAGVSGVWFPTVPDGFETEPAAAKAAKTEARAALKESHGH